MRRDEIEKINREREDFLRAIKESDINYIKEFFPQVKLIFTGEELGIGSRVVKDPLRSLKNITLSYNTLYFTSALSGGMDPLIGHYMAEKYAILIEYVDNEDDLWSIHEEMLYNYASRENRLHNKSLDTLSRKINAYIDNNFMEDINNDSLALHFNISKEHMMRIYKKETGDTINNYLVAKRINEAKELLLLSDLSMTEIAFRVGFKNSQYFSNSFKKNTGFSPKDYRKSK